MRTPEPRSAALGLEERSGRSAAGPLRQAARATRRGAEVAFPGSRNTTASCGSSHPRPTRGWAAVCAAPAGGRGLPDRRAAVKIWIATWIFVKTLLRIFK
jgi:hypothetical protein